MLNTAESIDLLGSSRMTLNRYIKKGLLSPVKKNGKNYFHKKDLLRVASTFIENEKKIPHSTQRKEVQINALPPTKLDFQVSEHQTAYTNILNKVKELQGDNFQLEVVSTLIESLIKSSVFENHYFQQLQSDPDNKEIYILWEKSTNLKINLSKRIGL